MRKIFFLLFTVLLVGGCASSERAFRMSGGVLDTYSAPKSFRLRSEKFQKMDKMSIPHRANKTAVGGINETLVNIWPFYFRSNNYFSVLWPMIDWDPYGMAIRPFYNNEGDDYSILFPFSAWNVADKSGWVANFRWTKNGFGFIPFTWQHRSKNDFWCYYTPFFIISCDCKKPGVDLKKVTSKPYSSEFAEFMLGYYGKEYRLDTKGCDSIFQWKPLQNEHLKYMVWKSGRKELKTQSDLRRLLKEIAPAFTVSESSYGGFFPLFHIRRTPDAGSIHWNILGVLANVTKDRTSTDVSIGGKWLYSYEYNEFDDFNTVINQKKFYKKSFLIPLLSGCEETTFIKETPQIKTLRALYRASRGSNFAQQLPKVNRELAKLEPGSKVPEFINTAYLLQIYIDDVIQDHYKKLKPEFYTRGKFNSPLFTKEWGYSKNDWYIFVLLSGGTNWTNGDWKWLSLPLLSGAGKTGDKDYLHILPPFIYSSSTKRFDYLGKYVHASDAKWSQRDNIESTDTYSACGLFYRGRVKFLVAKDGVSHKKVNELSALFKLLTRLKQSLDRCEKKYSGDLALADAITPRNTIEHYEKMIVLEKLKQRRSVLDKEWAHFRKEIVKAEELAKNLGVKFTVTDWAKTDQRDAAMRELYARTTATREKADIGNGLFFRKENFYNGDWKWRLFLNAAGGEKSGNKESTHVLHFLYRCRVEGDRMEKLIFPFISIQQDGKNSKVSFLGRIYQKSVIDGKSSGYIFFIPFGN